MDIKNILVLFALSVFSTACASFNRSYYPRIDKLPEVDCSVSDRRDVSFSVSYYQQVGDNMILHEKSLGKNIRKSLEQSGLFNHVDYLSFDRKSSYHYHFDVKITGTNPADQVGVGSLAGLTLLLVPTWLNFYVDTTMYLFVNGEEVFSITAPEKVVDIIWAPLIVLSPLFNHATIGYKISKHNINYFLSNIISNKLYSYPLNGNADIANQDITRVQHDDADYVKFLIR